MYFSCSGKKSTKRSRLKEALSRLLPQAKPPSLRIYPARTGLLLSILEQLLFRQKVSRLFA